MRSAAEYTSGYCVPVKLSCVENPLGRARATQTPESHCILTDNSTLHNCNT